MRLRPSRVLLATAVALQAALGGLALSEGASASTPSAPPPPLYAPLASALSTAAGSWALVAMGQRDRPLNTFWEALFRAPVPGAAWRLVTPRGVADNGGLTVAGAPTARFTVGFEPSQLLHYSPLALTLDDGVNWTPALVPTSLAPVPDALAVMSGPAGTTTLALVRRGHGQVLSSSGSLLAWQPLPGGGALAQGSDARCDAAGLDAVAYDPSGTPLVGTGCRRAGRVGVFAHVGGAWKLIGPSLQGSSATSTTKVLRLDASGPLTSALVALNAPGRAGLLGLWRSAAGTWTTSQPLTMGKAQMLASAVGANGQQLVLLTTGSRDLLEQTAGPGQPWAVLPSPPARTVTVALLGDGSIDAFSVNGTALRIFTLPAHGTAWSASQRMTVPLSYGSS